MLKEETLDHARKESHHTDEVDLQNGSRWSWPFLQNISSLYLSSLIITIVIVLRLASCLCIFRLVVIVFPWPFSEDCRYIVKVAKDLRSRWKKWKDEAKQENFLRIMICVEGY